MGAVAFAIFAASTPAQKKEPAKSGQRDALYAQSEWLKATFTDDGYAPDVRLVLPRLDLPVTDPILFPGDEPPSTAKTTPFGGKSSSSESSSASGSSIKPVKPTEQETKVQWAPAIMEALLYTGAMHAFNLSQQPGTRDTLNGHWLQHYAS